MDSYSTVDGCRLVYEVHGDPGNPAILLIEGMGGDIPGWRRTIPTLAEGLFVVAYDQRGNGWSDAPDDPQDMRTFVDDAVELLDHLGIDRAHIYGQSFGGMVAAQLAISHPGRVRTLILAATHAGGGSVVRSRVSVFEIEEADMAIFSAAFVSEHPDDVKELYRIGVPQQPHAGRRQWEAMQAYYVADQLREIRSPVLVLHGSADRVVDVANAQVLADGIPGAEIVIIDGAGHVYQWEQPAVSDAAIMDFIARHPDV